jgi:F0F1-type ATP synthase gamma subunit
MDDKAPRRTGQQQKNPKKVGGPNLSAPLTATVNVGSVSLAEHHRALEAERAEVDSLRGLTAGFLQTHLASMISAFSAGFEAGRASVADPATGNAARDWRIKELQRELATARKAAVTKDRQIKSDGKQIAELQAQLEKSRDEIERIKLERDEAS